MKKEEKNIYVEFGKRLRSLRKSKGLTQIEFANVFELSHTAIVQYEAGSRKAPLAVLKQFANFFNMTLDELIDPDNSSKESEEHNKQNLTKYEVATELGFTSEEISILESGTKQIPRTFFEKFANYFNVDIDNLTAISLENERKHAIITNDEVLTNRYKMWQQAIGYHNHFTDEEIEQLIDYAKYLIIKREK